jgi:hypothetical protein
MATTKIWPVKCSVKNVIDYATNPEKTTESDLERVIDYAMNGEKIASRDEKTCYVSGVNCSADTALGEMLEVQKLFGKRKGNVAYHCYQSFRPGEITPEECHRLGVELARRMWGADYQVIVATHLDRDHLHNHLVCNSVSLIDGKKFNCNKGAYRRFRRLSDDICRENGYSVIEKPRGKTPRQIYMAEKMGAPTRYNLMRDAIDESISLSTDMDDFFALMRMRGYVIDYRDTRKYPTIRSIHSKKNTRMYQLGDEYELHRIFERVSENSLERVYQRQDEYIAGKRHPRRSYGYGGRSRKSARKIGGLKGLYYKYCYLMGYLPKKRHRPLSPEMKEAMRMCDKYSACARLLARESIDTIEDLQKYMENSEAEIDVLSQARNKIRNRLRREKNPETIGELKEKRNNLTEQIYSVRKDLKLARFTIDRSEQLRDDIRIEHEYFRGTRMKQRNKRCTNRDWER